MILEFPFDILRVKETVLRIDEKVLKYLIFHTPSTTEDTVINSVFTFTLRISFGLGMGEVVIGDLGFEKVPYPVNVPRRVKEVLFKVTPVPFCRITSTNPVFEP